MSRLDRFVAVVVGMLAFAAQSGLAKAQQFNSNNSISQPVQATVPDEVFFGPTTGQLSPAAASEVSAVLNDGEPILADCGCDTGPMDCDCGCEPCWLFSDEPALQSLRNQPLGCCCGWNYSVGGELRHRYMDERNRLRPQGDLERDTYQLWRFTPYLEVGNDWLQAYAQGIDASSFGEELPILPIDVNRADLLRYYLDARLISFDEGELRGRYGRLFLEYGDQHLLSPLGWSNTYRNFAGGKLYYAGPNWKVDGFVVRPSNGAAAAPAFRPYSFDQPDQSVLLSGIYATYKHAPHGTMDLFWIWNDENEPIMDRQDGSRHTLGGRYAGSIPVKYCCQVSHTYNWDMLGGWQFGEDSFQSGGADQDVSAGFVGASGGVTYQSLPWSPSIQALFWWGSGDSDANDGEINTVNTLYPLGHAYWGLIDNFNGANLLDYSVQASVQPAEKLKLAAQYHWFEKASTSDYIYNIAGAPLGGTTTAAGHIGNELDLTATYQVNANLQVQLGYFWFWYGAAVDDQPELRRNDAQQFYVMTTWGF